MDIKKESIVLIGYKGVGKSYYGKILSEVLGKRLIETDLLIEELYGGGYSCPDIFIKWGELFFRKLEKNVIEGLKDSKNAIISTGGGVVLEPENRVNLKKIGICIYLKGDKNLIKQRMFQNIVPSFLDPENLEESFEKMYKQREDLYLETCDYIIRI
jgi:shikimate kinase